MSLRGSASARDRMNCDMGGGWSDGNATQRAGTYGNPDAVPDISGISLPGHPAETANDVDGEVPIDRNESEQGLPNWLWGIFGILAGAVLVGIVMGTRKKGTN